MSRYFETELTDCTTRAEMKRRNYPVTDVGRTVTRTYRDLLVYRETGASLRELHTEGHNRFTSRARREALGALVAMGHVEALHTARHFPATAAKRGITRYLTLYRLTNAGAVQADAVLAASDLEAVACRRSRLGLGLGQGVVAP